MAGPRLGQHRAAKRGCRGPQRDGAGRVPCPLRPRQDRRPVTRPLSAGRLTEKPPNRHGQHKGRRRQSPDSPRVARLQGVRRADQQHTRLLGLSLYLHAGNPSGLVAPSRTAVDTWRSLRPRPLVPTCRLRSRSFGIRSPPKGPVPLIWGPELRVSLHDNAGRMTHLG
jgi:hypothetical protein